MRLNDDGAATKRGMVVSGASSFWGSGGRRLLSSFAVAGLLTGLFGCSPTISLDGAETGIPEVNMTLDEAKSLAIQHGGEIASYFPAEFSSSQRSTESSKALLPWCTGEDTYLWPGRVTIVLTEDVDMTAGLQPIADEWATRQGWEVSWQTTPKGNPKLVLDSADGTHANVAYYVDGTELWVDTVSPCFLLPGGFVYGTEY